MLNRGFVVFGSESTCFCFRINRNLIKESDFMTIAIFGTVIAWGIGLFLDANIDFNPAGFLELRTLLPIIVMGCFILKRFDKKER